MADVLEQPPTDAPDEAPDFDVRLCANCSSAMAADQDWCLECGTAQPGSLGSRPGWRSALTVVAMTGVLAIGAVAASYAALSSDAQREASAPAPPGANPTVTQPPAQTAPPAETTPTIPAPGDDAGGDGSGSGGGGGGGSGPLPSTPAPSTPAAPSGGTGSGGSSGGSGGGGSSAPAHTALSLSGAKLLDPNDRANTKGKPKNAIDGSESTSWQALPPKVEDDKGYGYGLVVTLDEAQEIDATKISTGTPGFTMTVYGAKSDAIPPDTIDTRWKKIEKVSDFDDDETVKVGERYKHLLLWIDDQPADVKVAITDVDVLG